jgi:hypothetical protein
VRVDFAARIIVICAIDRNPKYRPSRQLRGTDV